jgi:prepilin-type N-terminal cleavage/methylation domain-containing protein
LAFPTEKEKKMKKINRKGFTIAELLIVVAIIAVLVAIAIPVFTGALANAKHQTAVANVRSQYAEDVASYLATGSKQNTTAVLNAATIGNTGASASKSAGSITITGPSGASATAIKISPETYS